MLLWGMSEDPGPVNRRTRNWVGVCQSSAAPSSGSLLLCAGDSEEILVVSVSAASAVLKLRWTEVELQLHL